MGGLSQDGGMANVIICRVHVVNFATAFASIFLTVSHPQKILFKVTNSLACHVHIYTDWYKSSSACVTQQQFNMIRKKGD